MESIPIFISFDAEHDESLKNALIGQARYDNSPFNIINWSIKEPFPNNWQEKARDRIKRAKVVIVLCGEHTNSAKGVSIESEIARQEKIPYFLLKGHPDRHCAMPQTAWYEKMHPWTWDNLVQLLNGRR